MLYNACNTSVGGFRDLYWCARACKWGDLLPSVSVPAEDTEKSREDMTESQDDSSSDTDVNIGISGMAGTDR